jgi:rhamnosyltransferase
LTQDAVPESRAWLCNLVSAFGKSKRTAGVYGRQIAKPDAEDFEKLFFEKKYPVYEKVWNNSNWKEQDVVFSMVNAAVRKDLLLENPLSEETIVSEDYEWAYRMLAKGFLIAYEPSATVLHSHNYSLLQNFKRHFDIGYSYRQIYPKYNSLGFNFAGISFYCELLERSSLAKVPSILVDGFVRYSGLWLGRHSKLLPKGFCKALSNQKWFWK